MNKFQSPFQYSNNSPNRFYGTLMNSIPFASSIFNSLQTNNPKYKDFDEITDENQELIHKHSIYRDPSEPAASFANSKMYAEYIYSKIEVNKIKRIQDYRRMAAFAELSDAIDEICDEAVNLNRKKEVITFLYNNEEISDNARKELNKEWKYFIDLFELEHKGFDYFRQFLIDGELFFEHIISEDAENGIIGVMLLPPELISPVYRNRQNDYIENFVIRVAARNVDQRTSMSARQEEEIAILDKNQVTYINSGIWNEDKTIRLPFIENSRRAYKQLTLLEDSIVIYRLVRAPERLVFKIDVGNMSGPQAEAYLKRMMQQFWSKRSFSSQDGQVANSYNPQSMLDAYWFTKRGDSEGSTVDLMQGGQNLGELEDLKYFLEKLYKTLKVPVSRLSSDSVASASSEEITREELRFAKFVMRIQRQFAEGLKEGFITHLKLKGLYDLYEINKHDIKIEFTTPTNFQVAKNQQVLSMQLDNFSNITTNQSISETYAQKKYLDFTDDEILANRGYLRNDAAFRWELAQIEANGPDWKKQQAEALEIDPSIGQGDAAAVGGTEANIPDFGPAPELDTEVPEDTEDTEGADEIGDDTGPEPTPET